MVIDTALGHLDVLLRLVAYHNGVAGLIIPIVNHIAHPDTFPVPVIDLPPWEVAEGGVGAHGMAQPAQWSQLV